jgi:hypothetical protein
MTRFIGARRILFGGGRAVGLFAFSAATFTSGGQTGIDGPSLTTARSGLSGVGTDAWKNNTAYFNTSSGIQLWTVPATGTYRILATGASGGRTPSYSGGRGIMIQGDVVLTAGQVIKILVGQGGTNSSFDCNTGAGGGTFITLFDNTPLIIAGGSGGTARSNGLDAVSTEQGGTSEAGTAGGASGAGGSANQGPSGAGYSGNGQAAQWGSLGGTNNGIAQAFLNGGQGGSSVQQTPNVLGGFGGGASGHGNCCIGGGGGGGYGGGGATGSCQAGGGGGSYIITSATNKATSNGLYNGSAVTNLGTWNSASSSSDSSTFAPAGSVTITRL